MLLGKQWKQGGQDQLRRRGQTYWLVLGGSSGGTHSPRPVTVRHASGRVLRIRGSAECQWSSAPRSVHLLSSQGGCFRVLEGEARWQQGEEQVSGLSGRNLFQKFAVKERAWDLAKLFLNVFKDLSMLACHRHWEKKGYPRSRGQQSKVPEEGKEGRRAQVRGQLLKRTPLPVEQEGGERMGVNASRCLQSLGSKKFIQGDPE